MLASFNMLEMHLPGKREQERQKRRNLDTEDMHKVGARGDH